MLPLPDSLRTMIDDLSRITDRRERAEMLLEIADRFDAVRVPPEIATQPYDEAHRVPACESEAFVWAVEQPDGTLKFHFDVLNPQGLSAMAMGVLLSETLSGVPLETVESVPEEIVWQLFGRELSMGKGAGLMGIVSMVRAEAKRRRKAG